jgi:hypothetical protein
VAGCCERGDEQSGSVKGGGISWLAEWTLLHGVGVCVSCCRLSYINV